MWRQGAVLVFRTEMPEQDTRGGKGVGKSNKETRMVRVNRGDRNVGEVVFVPSCYGERMVTAKGDVERRCRVERDAGWVKNRRKLSVYYANVQCEFTREGGYESTHYHLPIGLFSLQNEFSMGGC